MSAKQLITYVHLQLEIVSVSLSLEVSQKEENEPRDTVQNDRLGFDYVKPSPYILVMHNTTSALL